MAKQLNVNLAFSADTSKVRAQLQDLQNQLQKLTLSSKGQLGITHDIEAASKAAAELSVHLQQATNVRTGSLDFSKLNQSIKKSGTTLQQYGKSLQSLGPQGQQAFLSLAQAVANSEVPIRRTNAMLKEMGTTLANTARWQLSSSILHGFMGAVQSAYGYAQDLNESLNNIRIVTGQNIDQMAKFAEEANKAARALSTTTTEYTNASLIYYQQGLSDQQVKERTDITIKMANVARQSAETVSDQMTAVWNNFYDGSKSLEHYADVMTALGAATASSTQEISEGLNKFAAVAETVGLSYEYAAAALATVTATTRQSADIVGTAFKTLFARIQDLDLGKTLDDGTTLGTYSQALEKVGINIKDVSGEMKTMDVILEEMAAKWATLGKDQQVALAQSVAGVRQYTQLIALMDNWDFMEKNLVTANSADGALQEQADIYAESWEAASKRVKATAESLYKALINDEFFIDVLDGIEKIIGFVDHLIDNLGGLKGTLSAIGAIVTKLFANQISQGLTNMVYNVKMLTKSGREAEQQSRKKVIDDAIAATPKSKEYSPETEKALQNSMRSQLELQQEMLVNADKMNAVEQQRNQMLLDRNKQMQEAIVLAAEAEDAAIAKKGKAVDAVQTRVAANSNGDVQKQREAYRQITEEAQKMRASFSAHAEIDSFFQAYKQGGEQSAEAVRKLQTQITSLKSTNPAVQALIASMNDYDLTVDNVEENVTTLKAQIKALVTDSANTLKTSIIPEDQMKEGAAEIDNLVTSIDEQTQAELRRKNAVQEGAQAHEAAKTAIRDSVGSQKQWSDLLVESANLAFSAATAMRMLGSAFETLRSPDTSGWEKFLTVLTTLGMVVPTLISIFSTLKSLLAAENVAKLANIAATWGQVAAEKALNKTKGQSNPVTRKNIKETWQDTGKKIKNTGSKIKGKFTNFKNNFNTSAWHKQQGMMQGPGSAQQVSAAGKTAAKGLGGMAASVGFIIAGIAIIAGGVKWGISQATKAEKELEKAKEQAKQLKEQFDLVSTAYNDFTSKVSNFESATNGLENLTKGTEEYRQAAYEANQAAMELIKTNKNLKYSIQDGLIVFDEGELDKASRQQRAALARAQGAKNLGDAQVLRAEEALSTRNLSRDLDSKADTGQKWGNVLGAGGTGLLGGAAIGAGIGTAVGGWAMGMGTVIGAIIGAVVGLVGGVVTGLVANAEIGTAVDYEKNALNKIAKAYERDSSILAQEDSELAAYLSKSTAEGGLGIDDTELVNSLVANRDSVNELVTTIVANTNAINAQNDLIASQLLGDNGIVTSSEHADAIIDKAGDIYGYAVEEALNSRGTQNWGKVGISQATGVNEEAQEVFDDYLKYAGLEGKGYQLVDTTGTDEDRKFVYLDESGDRKEVTLKTMQYAKATYEAAGKMESAAMELTALFAQWANKEDSSSQAVLSFLKTGNFDDATKAEFDSVQSDVEKAGGAEAYLTAQFGDLEAAAETYGYDTAQDFIDAFNFALSSGVTGWADILFPSDLEPTITQNVTMSTAKTLENLVNIINAGPIREMAGEQFVSGINKMLAGMDPKDQEEALRRIVEIDWSAYDAGYQVIDIINELGYSVNMTDAEFKQWNDTMNVANSAVSNYAELVENLQKIESLAKDIKIGDILTEEDYERLVKYNKELSKYFMIGGDGKATFIGDVLDFQQAAKDTVVSEKFDALTQTRTDVEVLENRRAVNNSMSKYGGRGMLQQNAYQHTDTRTWTEQNDPNGWHIFLGHLSAMGQAMGSGSSGVYTGRPQTVSEASREIAGTTEKSEEIWSVVGSQYQNQLDFLSENGVDISKYASAENATKTDANAVLNAVQELIQRNPVVSATTMEEAQRNVFAAEIDYARTAETVEDREAMFEQGYISKEAYGVASQEAIMTEKWENMDASAVQAYADSLREAADSSDLLFDNMSEEAAEDVALYVQKMNKGIQTLSSNIEEWADILDKSDKSSQEYAEAMGGLKLAMSDVLGTSEDFIEDDFLAQHLEEIKKAAEGDAEAIDALKVLLAEDILCNIMVVDNFEDLNTDIQNFHNQILNMDSTMEVGAVLDTTEFQTAAQGLINSAGMTVEQAQAYFNSLGYEPTFVMEEKEVPLEGSRTYTDNVVVGTKELQSDGGTRYFDYIESSETYTEPVTGARTQKISVPALSADGTPQIESITKTSSGAMNNLSGANKGGKSGGGGGSKPKKSPKTHQSKVVDRYKEVNDAISDTKKAMEDAQRAAEGLWGAARIKKMREVQAEMGKELQLLRQKKAEAEAYLKQDKKWLEEVAAENGVQFTFDGNNISNYEEIMNGLYQELRQAEIAAGPTVEEEEQERIDAIQERIDAITEAVGIYDKTKDEVKDFDTEIQEAIRSIQEAKLNELNLELEMKIMIDDTQLAKLEYYLGKVQEDIWGMAEAAALMTGRNIDMFGFDEGQADVWLGKFDTFKKRYDDLVYNYTHINPETGETFINQEQFVKALQELQNDIYSNLSNIDQLDKTMIGYYGETLAAAAEELSKFTDMMDHHNDVLDHYMSLLEIMGKSKDFERMKTLLKTQVEVAENSAKVSKANYEMLQAELQEKKAAYDALDPEDTSYEAQVIRQQWLDAQAAANEAQLKMLEDAEAWAEALKALLETELEELGENLEKALSGEFGSLDNLMTSMERANSLQEEYLTTTNKIYETNKLMRTAQQEIDKTSNTVAKRRMAQFIEETQQMQNQNKLSSYELEIQQAKYDLLLAEIALEEAQSAKSTVRLQRDNEGNFGYVYTADQNEVANAQQQLEDAQNALYNIGLEGANKYAEQYAQTIQEMNDAVRELTEQWQNGEIASKEEYQAKMLELEENS